MPSDTKELAVYIGRYRYADKGGSRELIVPFGEIVSHIKPSTKKIPANVLPEGASWSSTTRLSCPRKPDGERVLLGIFALDSVQSRVMTPVLAKRLTEEALSESSPTEHPRSPGTLTREAAGAGWLDTTYTGTH